MNFYVLDYHSMWFKRYAETLPKEELDPIFCEGRKKCPTCKTNIVMTERFLREVRLSKKKVGDFIFSMASPDELIVSHAFKQAYEKSGLQGILHFKKVKTFFRRQPLPTSQPYYWALVDTITPFIDLREEIYGKMPSPPCSTCQRGRSSGDGTKKIVFLYPEKIKEDIFISHQHRSQVMCNQRFKDFVEAHRFTNAIFFPAERYEYYHYYRGHPKYYTYLQPNRRIRTPQSLWQNFKEEYFGGQHYLFLDLSYCPLYERDLGESEEDILQRANTYYRTHRLEKQHELELLKLVCYDLKASTVPPIPKKK